MVKSRKSLLILILLSLFNFSVFSAVEESGGDLTDSAEVIATEQDTYFSDYYNNSAEKVASNKKSSTSGYLVKMIVVLVIVVALIYGVLWFIKKKTHVVKSEDDYLRRAAYIDIGPGKSVEVITLLDKGYLIGVTEDKITLLGEIDDKELISAMNVNADKNQNTKKPVNFAEVLEMLTQKGGKSKSVFDESEKKMDNIFNKK
ncbi:MAG: flagellar biosynthetic protein FliO [Spirochaetia bacterium]|nr:flagellar biosynthetic protein FliO [Spirochaetia bacterium]